MYLKDFIIKINNAKSCYFVEYLIEVLIKNSLAFTEPPIIGMRPERFF